MNAYGSNANVHRHCKLQPGLESVHAGMHTMRHRSHLLLIAILVQCADCDQRPESGVQVTVISINAQPASCAATAQELVLHVLQQASVRHVHVLGAMPVPAAAEGRLLRIPIAGDTDSKCATCFARVGDASCCTIIQHFNLY